MEAISPIDNTASSIENDYSMTQENSPKGVVDDSGSLSISCAQFDQIIAARNDRKVKLEDRQKLYNEKKANREKVRRRQDGHEPIGFGFRIKDFEMAIIADIINFMDSKSTIAMAFPSNQKYLKDQGKRINHLHPLCFIWTIARDDGLKAKLRIFRDNSAFALKWNGFLGYSAFHDKGFGRNMEKYYNHRNPGDYQHEFDAFYRSLNIKADVMSPYAQSKDWKGFSSAIIEPSSYN
ncbi:hypothetical protein COB11_02175 [Candidatus Aerophobetes bacterium]|uniref:Uncharacterized protein n=1 Tax=Aerophobetes bacterium TaxID=2030807 RepID=A0A2A4YL63_UNCAE|nr:MAG: hypothetical protein COB11_02175 [Candidatus Aerophobetes bacterium]